jgi:hypothetical protein
VLRAFVIIVVVLRFQNVDSETSNTNVYAMYYYLKNFTG